jgi:hypothetical protein
MAKVLDGSICLTDWKVSSVLIVDNAHILLYMQCAGIGNLNGKASLAQKMNQNSVTHIVKLK